MPDQPLPSQKCLHMQLLKIMQENLAIILFVSSNINSNGLRHLLKQILFNQDRSQRNQFTRNRSSQKTRKKRVQLKERISLMAKLKRSPAIYMSVFSISTVKQRKPLSSLDLTIYTVIEMDKTATNAARIS